jgi:hypothetical protein
MKFVFESKNTKESTIEEMKELFHEKSEEIVNILWSLTEKIYSNDLLEEIYQDKGEKKFPSSQIINPNAEQKTKHIFSSAIKDVRGEKSRRKSSQDDERKGRKDDSVRTYTVNDKKVVIRRKNRSRSRSRSKEKKGSEGDYEQEPKEYRDNKYGNDYYMQPRGYYPRGRGFKRGFGGRFMMPRYMDPRR